MDVEAALIAAVRRKLDGRYDDLAEASEMLACDHARQAAVRAGMRALVGQQKTDLQLVLLWCYTCSHCLLARGTIVGIAAVPSDALYCSIACAVSV